MHDWAWLQTKPRGTHRNDLGFSTMHRCGLDVCGSLKRSLLLRSNILEVVNKVTHTSAIVVCKYLSCRRLGQTERNVVRLAENRSRN